MSLVSPVKIKSRLASKLKQLAFRRRFFRARAQEEIAQQIRELRERRKLRQIDLAKSARMKQSAISRIEQIGYSAWTFKTLLRVADALDAQIRVIFEAAEDVIARYENEERQPVAGTLAGFPAFKEASSAFLVGTQLWNVLKGKGREQGGDPAALTPSPFGGALELPPALDKLRKPVGRQGNFGRPQIRTLLQAQEELGQ